MQDSNYEYDKPDCKIFADSEFGEDVTEYLNKLVSRSLRYKIVQKHPDDEWCGDWWSGVPIKPHFLVYISKNYIVDCENGLCHYIVCTGDDDFFMVQRNLSQTQANEMFDSIVDGTSMSNLEEMGFFVG